MHMNWPNRITIFRIILIPVFITLMQYYKTSAASQGEIYRICAIVVFISAVLSDALDGFLARFLKQKTQIGVVLDPLADKFLLTTAIVLLTTDIPALNARLPIWFTCLIIGRDCFIVIGCLIVYMLNGDVKIVPSKMGKITTVLQMTTVLWILFKIPSYHILIYCTAIATVYSGIQYILFGSAQLHDQERKNL